MNTKRMLLLAVALGAIVATAAPTQTADLLPAVVTSLTGSLQISQKIPCNGTVNVTTSVNGGRMELSPAEGVDVGGGKLFALTRATISFAGFSASGSCGMFGDTRNYTELEVQLVKGVSFVAAPGSPGVYDVTIPKDDIEFWQAP